MDARTITDLVGNIIGALFVACIIVVTVMQETGYILIRLKLYRWATTYYTSLIWLVPWSEALYINRAWARLCLAEFDEAIEDCDQALKINLEAAMAYNNRSAAQLGLQHYPEALQDANQAILMDNKLGSAYYNRAYALVKLGNYAAALKDYDRAIEQRPRLYNQYYMRGNCHLYLQHYLEAMADYNKAIELDPSAQNVYHSRGILFMIYDDYQQGLADLEKSCELAPYELFHPLVLQWCQLCLHPQLNNEVRARFAALAPLVDGHNAWHLYQGMSLWFEGTYADALSQFELYIAADHRGSETGYFWSGMALAAQGHYEEARRVIDYALKHNLPRFFLQTLALLPSKHSGFADRYL
ncbi:hypothetical protein KDA_43900 [Dictyobacter alpinus]|uniref:Uncharacterized protein n=1 Tax=Dictyobacter alpinus TaxID=2014873 RepID=A0A402BC57_9CHLR|nr:tetratricopeptide repeat protein [Dictyobacter alpinus]GCE28906.1 hypothetical protein KDA_43900 [Dictyobacter alpinus]